jgi:hypothetical protein
MTVFVLYTRGGTPTGVPSVTDRSLTGGDNA